MGITTANRNHFIFITILAMIAAPFISRATLSISMILFIAATTLHKNMGAQFRNFFKTPWLVGMALLFLLPFVSGLWSADVQEWRNLVRIKLPLLLLPVAFAGNWQLRTYQWRMAALLFLLVIIAGTAWSFEKYWVDRAAISESYLRAKVFLTPLQNDHVRFSWLVAVATLLCLYFIDCEKRWLKVVAVICVVWFSIYLHLSQRLIL